MPEVKDAVVVEAEELVRRVMGSWDSSHDAFHAFRVRTVAVALASEEALPTDRLKIVELAALLHDIDDHKYADREKGENETSEGFLRSQGVDEDNIKAIMEIIKNIGFKEEIGGGTNFQQTLEFKIVQDADRLDAIGAIGIARCLTFGGSRNRVLHDPEVLPRSNLTKEDYMKGDAKQTTLNHFHEKLLKLKGLMKTKAGRLRAEGRHTYMESFLSQFYNEWYGKA